MSCHEAVDAVSGLLIVAALVMNLMAMRHVRRAEEELKRLNVPDA